MKLIVFTAFLNRMLKKSFLLLTFILFVLSINQSCVKNPTSSDETQTESIKLATWNIRILSNGSRDDTELAQIADILQRYDLIAIQEARDTIVLDRLLTILPEYNYIASSPVGRTVKEIYAFFYKPSVISTIGTAYTFPDPNDDFIREPFVGCFKSGNFDFTLVTIHVLYGDSEAERREEIKLLDDVLLNVDENNGGEKDIILLGDFNFDSTKDIILLGDFNFDSTDSGWQTTTYDPVISPSTKTTISDSSSYDNIWINPDYTSEYQELLEVYKFDEVEFNNDDKAASLAVSDHRPVAVIFNTDSQDDDAGTGCINPDYNPIYSGNPDVRIYSVTASPTDSEQVTLKNYSSFTADISHWTIGDKNNPIAYTIPYNTYLGASETKTFPHTTLGFGINDTGEIIYLKDTAGITIDTWSN